MNAKFSAMKLKEVADAMLIQSKQLDDAHDLLEQLVDLGGLSDHQLGLVDAAMALLEVA